jgi:hypothetical protein
MAEHMTAEQELQHVASEMLKYNEMGLTARQLRIAISGFADDLRDLAARLSGMAAVKEKEAAEYRANFPEQFWDANELLHDYMAYANAPDSGFADESMRLHKLNERAKAMGLTPPKPEGSVT